MLADPGAVWHETSGGPAIPRRQAQDRSQPRRRDGCHLCGRRPCAGQDDWTGPEVRATVADYLAMLAAEAAGKPYSKTEHRRALSMALNGIRSDGAIEFKHQNISAVMQELGLPYIGGYKPRGNYQAALLQEVQRQLDADPALFAVLQPATGDAVTGTALPPAPEPSAPPAGAQPDRAPGMDARALLESLTGRQILTITGQPNTIMGVAGDDVLVATGRSPAGQPVPVGSVQSGLDRLLETAEIEVSTASLGHRSSFIGAVLRTLPGTVVIPATPPRIRLTDPATAYRLSEAGPISVWWAGDARQRFWLEITDRPDIGVDLHCPQRDAIGSRTPGYSLIWSVEPGDVIFHYRLQKRAITAWSHAAGQVTEAPTVWLSHRGATRRRLNDAARPGRLVARPGRPLPAGSAADPLPAPRPHRRYPRHPRQAESSTHRQPLLPLHLLGRQRTAAHAALPEQAPRRARSACSRPSPPPQRHQRRSRPPAPPCQGSARPTGKRR